MRSSSSLNHFYRTVWNQALKTMVAVAETSVTRSSSGGSTGFVGGVATGPSMLQFFKLKTLAMAVAIVWTATHFVAYANPAGGVAIVGQASMAAQGNKLTVTTQNGAGLNHSAINWQSFSIPKGETTYFQQPNTASMSINRVVTQTPSLLFGTLGSNGHLVLVNQSGITVGQGAVVDTAGFTASALRMSDADALIGRLNFGEAGASGAGVSVMGNILARSGDVVLIGSGVDTGKDALIQSPNGNTILAAGQHIDITGRGLEGITFHIQAPENQAVNLGTLKGGAVGIFAGTLKHSGQIKANTISLEGGRVVLKASGDALVEGTGKIEATGTVGGSVDVFGQRVAVTDQAVVDVSGSLAGGSVRVGGDYQGKNANVPNANVTYVGSQASILADATVKGDGGRVIVWADDTTRAFGSISAKGGGQGGDGGFVETSGKKYLDFRAHVDTTASQGMTGTLLLDPANITIQLNDPNINGDGTMGDDILNATDLSLDASFPGANSVITSAALQNLLPDNDVTLAATNDITVSSSVTRSSGGTAKTLTLQAGRNIAINNGVFISGSTGNALHVTLNAGSASTIAGTIDNSGGTTTLSGSTTLSGTLMNGTVVVTGEMPSLNSSFGVLNGVTLGDATHNILNTNGILDINNGLTLADGMTVNKGSGNWNFVTAGLQHIAVQGSTGTATVFDAGGTIYATAGTLQIDSGLTVQGYGGFATYGTAAIINNGSVITDVAGKASTISASTFINNGSLSAVAGTLTLSPATLTNTGSLDIRGGTVNIQPSNTSTWSNAGSITLSTGTLNVNGGVTNYGTLSGTGTITVGTGTAGLINQGTINPGGTDIAGTLTINGDVQLVPNSVLNMEIGGASAGSEYDVLAVTGKVALDGTLNSTPINGFTLNGQSFDVITAGTATGGFTTLNLPAGVNGAIVNVPIYRLTHSDMTCTGVCWDGGAGTYAWEDDKNWTGDVLPTDTSLVQLNLVLGVDATLSSTQSIKGLDTAIDNNLTINTGGALTLNDPAVTSHLAGNLRLDGGSLLGNGDLNSSGNLVMADGIMTLNGVNNISALAMMGGALTGSGTVNVDGSFAQSGGVINTTGNLSIQQSRDILTVGKITANNISLRAPTLAITDDIQARYVNLSADNPITVDAGKKVIGWNDAGGWGDLNFDAYSPETPVVVGVDGLVDGAQISAYGGGGVFQSPYIGFNSSISLTVSSDLVVAGDVSLGLYAPTLNINGNVQARSLNLNADNPIQVAAGKTVKGFNGDAANPNGTISFAHYSFENPLVLSADNVADMSRIGGNRIFQASDMNFSSGSAVTMDASPEGLNSIRLSAPQLIINRNIQANNVSLETDNPITVKAGVIVMGSNGDLGNPYGTIYFSPYTYDKPMVVGDGGWASAGDFSPLGTTKAFQASEMHFSSGSALAVNAAPVGLQSIGLHAPDVTINDNVQAGYVSLNMDHLTVTTGKTVTGSNGDAINPRGTLAFSPSNWDKPLILGVGGWVDTTQLAKLDGLGTFRASDVNFYSGNALTVDSFPVGLENVKFQAPTLTINDNLQAGTVYLYAQNTPLILSHNVTAGYLGIYAPAGLTNLATLSGSGYISVGTGTTGLNNQGTLNLGGTGAIGTLTVNGDLQLGADSVLNVDLGGIWSGESDLLDVSGNVTLAGTLNANLLPGYTPGNTDAIPFVLMRGAYSGTFTAENRPQHSSVGYGLQGGEAARMIFADGDIAVFTNKSGGLDWSDPANWSTGSLPVATDTALISVGYKWAVTHKTDATDTVAALTINDGNSLDVSAGSVTVLGTTTLDGSLTVSGAGTTTLNGALNGGLSGRLDVLGGSLNLGSEAWVRTLNMTGGSVSGAGSLDVNGYFDQTGGVIAMGGTVAIKQVEGDLSVGNMGGSSITLTADGGGISQWDMTALTTEGQLATQSATGTILSNTGNHAGVWVAFNSESGNMALSNLGALTLASVSNASGGVSVINAGSIWVTDSIAAHGDVSLTATDINSHAASSVTSYGGNVSLDTQGTGGISFGNINTTSSGDAGSVTLFTPGFVNVGNIDARGFNGGNGGNVTVTANGDGDYVSNLGVIRANGGSSTELTGSGGFIAVTAQHAIQLQGDMSTNLTSFGATDSVVTLQTPGDLSVYGTVSASAIEVSADTFTLGSGTWHQVAATLPAFAVNAFSILGGSFVRATGGDGSVLSPYQLADIYGVQGMGSMPDQSYRLANDVNASATVNWNAGAGFVPIGNLGTAFTGTFEGMNHTISGLVINRPTENNVGLLGRVTGGVIQNVGLVNINVNGSWNVGTLAGANGGDISGSYATGNVQDGDGSVVIGGTGGLVGYNSGTIQNSYADVGVAAVDIVYSEGGIGGLVGYNQGIITNTYAAGHLTGPAGNAVGGLVGKNTGTVNDSFWNTDAFGNSTSQGGTGLTSVQMMQFASFGSWGESIANTGDAGTVWRIYEGHTAPLLAGFMPVATLLNSSVTYNGATQTGEEHDRVMAASGRNVGNYTAYSTQQGYDIVGGDLTIDKAVITAIKGMLAAHKIYDGTTSAEIDATYANFSGMVSGDNLEVTFASGSFGDKNVGIGKTVTITGLSLSGSDAGNYQIESTVTSTSADITAKSLTLAAVTAANKVYDGSVDATVSGSSLTGVIGSEDVSLSGLTGSFDTKNVGTAKTVTVNGGTWQAQTLATIKLQAL
jgi:filamentous hemagglutinin family protein